MPDLKQASGELASPSQVSTEDTKPVHQNVERLVSGSIGITLARLSAPNTIGFLVGSGVTVAELWYVGQLGTAPLAGLALGFPMFMLMMMLSAGSMGGAIAASVARASGAGDRRKADALAWHGVAIALIASTVLALLYLAFGPEFFYLLGGRDETLQAALEYSDIVFLGCVAIWLLNTFGSLLRGAGDMKSPAIALVLAAVIQIPVSGLLALGWGSFEGLGISGVAWGALIGFAVSTVFLGSRLLSGKSGITLSTRLPSFKWALFKDILRIGAIASVNPFLTVTSIIFLAAIVSKFGVAPLAGFGVAARIEFLLIPIVFGIGAAMLSLVGASMGSGNVDRAHKVGWTGGLFAAFFAGLIGSATAIWAHEWAGLFTNDPEVIAAATIFLIIVGPFYAFFGLGLSLYFASQGAGTVTWPVVSSAIRLSIVIVGGFYALSLSEGGFTVLSISVALGMTVFGILTASSLLFGAWRRAAEKMHRA
ncbi:MAG: MATE family efflux transporter [Proteobacteria bacterium]|nr:MATE family efflux transporter [Pseudomonadota bacterium]